MNTKVEPHALDAIWESLSLNVDSLLNKKPTSTSFDTDYGNVYILYNNSRAPFMYERVVLKLKDLMARQRAAITDSIQKGDDILDAITESWEYVCEVVFRVSQIFLYLEKHYCTTYKNPPFSEVTKKLFSEEILAPRRNVLLETLNEALSAERSGKIVQSDRLRVITHLLSTDNNETFEQLVEKPYFLKLKKAFVSKINEITGSSCTLKQYLDSLDTCRKNELDRIDKHFFAESIVKLEALIDDVWLETQSSKLFPLTTCQTNDEDSACTLSAWHSFENCDSETLSRLVCFCARRPSSLLRKLEKCFAAWLETSVSSVVQRYHSPSGGDVVESKPQTVEGKEAKKENQIRIEMMIEETINLLSKAKKIVETALSHVALQRNGGINLRPEASEYFKKKCEQLKKLHNLNKPVYAYSVFNPFLSKSPSQPNSGSSAVIPDPHRRNLKFELEFAAQSLKSGVFVNAENQLSNAFKKGLNSAGNGTVVAEALCEYVEKIIVQSISSTSTASIDQKQSVLLTSSTANENNAEEEQQDVLMAGEEVSLESRLMGVILLFKFLIARDAFELRYRSKLAKRLLRTRNVSDADKMLISKLKAECGSQFTHKLNAMITDASAGVSVISEFNNKVQLLLKAPSQTDSNTNSSNNVGRAVTPQQQNENFLSWKLVFGDLNALNSSSDTADVDEEKRREFASLVDVFEPLVVTIAHWPSSAITASQIIVPSQGSASANANNANTNNYSKTTAGSVIQKSVVQPGDKKKKSSSSLFMMPQMMAPVLTAFEIFYSWKFSSKTLSWLHNEGQMQVRGKWMVVDANSPGSPVWKGFLLNLPSPICGAVLLLFNALDVKKAGAITWRSIVNKLLPSLSSDKDMIADGQNTFVEMGWLFDAIYTLCANKVLKIDRTGDGKSKDSASFNLDDSFSINEEFKPTGRVVNIKPAKPKTKIEKEKIAESQAANVAILENRRFIIEAIIVKIMKSRKSLNHRQLETEVAKQVLETSGGGFELESRQLKMVVESLIERDYLDRDPEDHQLYKYVA
eukprot:GDKJ01011219.1.p1 GENE.GDKJ01011219.1~~GDKJ01011219.1.p1  ORF type:complete len:1030 (+),score=246.96 GDKJ01011219.1:45-3134(+)